jgi:Sec7-like guanine-nucleotide exchange factor
MPSSSGEISALLQDDFPESLSGKLEANSSCQKKVLPDQIDLNDSDSDLSEISTVSRKFIEPDVGSLNKLLNFDSGDDSCDVLLDDVRNVTSLTRNSTPALKRSSAAAGPKCRPPWPWPTSAWRRWATSGVCMPSQILRHCQMKAQPRKC